MMRYAVQMHIVGEILTFFFVLGACFGTLLTLLFFTIVRGVRSHDIF